MSMQYCFICERLNDTDFIDHNEETNTCEEY